MVRKVSQALMVLGMLGLVLSFTALLRDRWGAGRYSAGGVILLAVGALLYWLSSQKGSNKSPREHEEPDSRPKAAGYVPWVPLVTSGIVAAIAGLFRDEPDGTFIGLGIVGLVMAAVGIMGMTRIWRHRHR